MKKVKCINGHFFDLDRFQTCPSCGAEPVGEPSPAVPKNKEQAPLTAALMQEVDLGTVAVPVSPALEGDTHEASDATTLKQEIEGDYTAKDKPQQEGSLLKTGLAAAVEATESKNVPAMPKTVAYYDMGELTPPVGWLVCIGGTYAGRAFECKSGRNRIGRGMDMDVCLSEDATISRDTHATIIYEPKKRIFYLQAGTSSGLTYCNGTLVFDHEEIHAYDKIELGKAMFLFYPLCGEKFTWDDYMEKG